MEERIALLQSRYEQIRGRGGWFASRAKLFSNLHSIHKRHSKVHRIHQRSCAYKELACSYGIEGYERLEGLRGFERGTELRGLFSGKSFPFMGMNSPLKS